MKSRLLPFVLSFATMSAWGLSFKATMQPLKLPLTLALSLPAEQPETTPGEMTVGLQRMCGDGDVAHLAKENPTLEFVPQSTSSIDVIAGYWIVEGDHSPSVDYVPTPTNFMPVAYIKGAPIGNNPASLAISTEFLPINHSLTAGRNGLDILASEIVGVYKNGKRSYASNKSFRLLSGVFTCLNVDDASALVRLGSANYDYQPTPTEISNQVAHESGLSLTIYDTIKNLSESDYTSGNFPKVMAHIIGSTTGSNLKFPVDTTSAYSPLKIFLDKDNSSLKSQSGASGLSSSEIYSLEGTSSYAKFTQIMNLPWPDLSTAPIADTRPDPVTTPAPVLAAWDASHPTDTDKINFLNTKINQWKSALDISVTTPTSARLTYCGDVGLNTNQNIPLYKWEAFPMNVSCRKLYNEPAGTSPDSMELVSAFNQLTKSISIASDISNLQTNFYKYKRTLATRFFIANALEVFQRKATLDTALKISHANCFNTGGKPLISRLVGSYPLRFEVPATSTAYGLKPNPANHIHPEPLFALDDWFEYKDSDVMGLWGQVISRAPVYPPGSFTGDFYGYSGIDLSGVMYGDPVLESYPIPEPAPAEPIKPEEWGIALPVNDKSLLDATEVNGNTFKGPAVNILFKIRSVGGNCPGFC